MSVTIFRIFFMLYYPFVLYTEFLYSVFLAALVFAIQSIYDCFVCSVPCIVLSSCYHGLCALRPRYDL